MAVVSVVSPAAKAAEPEIQTPHACVMEVSTGEVLYEKKADERLHPASVTKVMTILLIFEALDAEKLRRDGDGYGLWQTAGDTAETEKSVPSRKVWD